MQQAWAVRDDERDGAVGDFNGDSDPRLYGSDPNNGNTWDADRIYGCICSQLDWL